MKNKKFLLLSFFIPFIIFITFFYINGLLTDRMMIIGDSHAQYYPLFHYLKGILNGTNSIFYSFSKSIGGSMFGTFFYYLSNPINLLIYFIKEEFILDFMTYMTIFKLSLCGLTMYIYMSKKFKTNSYMLLIFSVLYSLSDYNLNYFLNIMWLDIIALAPIVLLGIDKIIENKSPILYILTLIYCIYSNYYISYMLCIFCVLYFIYEILLKYNFKNNKKEILNISKKFIIYSLLSGLICSFFLVPCILEMLDYGRGSNIKDIFILKYNIFNLLANTYIGSVDTTHPFNTYSINLYCGIIIFPLIYLYFKNKNINKKEKILSLVLISSMILPCFIEPLNYIWHLFTTPYGYNYRYSFLLILFLLRIAYKSCNDFSINKANILEYLSIYISYSVIVIFVMYFKDYYPYLDYIKIWLSNIFLIIYFLLLYKIKDKKILNKIIFTLILIESIINVGIVLNNKDFLKRDLLEYKYEYMTKYETDKRISTIKLDYNPSFITNTLNPNIFISTENSKAIYLLTMISYNNEPIKGSNGFMTYKNHPYIFNSLFGNEIIITPEYIPNYEILENTHIYDLDYTVYKNKNALPIGYTVNSNCNNLEFSFPYDEKVLNCLLGEDNEFYKKIPYSIDNNKIIYTIDKDFYYLYLPNIKDNIDYLKSIFKDNILIIKDNYLYISNKSEKTINLEIESEYLNDLKIYYFDYDLFEEKIQLLKNSSINYTINKNEMTANIYTENGLFMLTIPYENGIKVYLDNKFIKPEKVLDTLIGINLDKGEHKLKIVYNQPGLKVGITTSIISIIILIIYIKKQQKNNIQ